MSTLSQKSVAVEIQSGEPVLMREMIHVLGVDGALAGEARKAAAGRCEGCTDRDDCRHWLDIAALAGAEHAPGFCRNVETFDALASEAPSTF
ncbi:DUF6455 family protein [Chthonobacter albigriseus]|uniref:DUF6455 family protein n=1 Tax=Chthonobacter albigriseus TaxID=1683161 RepID=UPI0015EF0005|nr:DUF6455 family protein [Chthonobacter albigriseus]